MPKRAPRGPWRPWRGLARGAWVAAALVAPGAGAQTDPATSEAREAPEIIGAHYADPTTRYPHGALGDPVEWGALRLELLSGRMVTIRLPEHRVFEDTEPRLADMDGDGLPEVVVVEADARLGARLAVYDTTGVRAATDFIGQRNRWLAPIGIADLDGDGQVELAYIDRPHLARILRVVRDDGAGRLVEVARAEGHTNHRFGDPDIPGGIFDCGMGPELVTADPRWRQVLGTRLKSGALVTRALGAYRGDLVCP